MGHYPFTMFNAVTALVLALALLLAWRRFRGSQAANWPLLGYAAMAVYTIAFSGSLNPYGVAAGVVCAVAIRFGFYPTHLRWLDAIVLAYIAYRCLALLLMW